MLLSAGLLELDELLELFGLLGVEGLFWAGLLAGEEDVLLSLSLELSEEDSSSEAELSDSEDVSDWSKLLSLLDSELSRDGSEESLLLSEPLLPPQDVMASISAAASNKLTSFFIS